MRISEGETEIAVSTNGTNSSPAVSTGPRTAEVLEALLPRVVERLAIINCSEASYPLFWRIHRVVNNRSSGRLLRGKFRRIHRSHPQCGAKNKQGRARGARCVFGNPRIPRRRGNQESTSRAALSKRISFLGYAEQAGISREDVRQAVAVEVKPSQNRTH